MASATVTWILPKIKHIQRHWRCSACVWSWSETLTQSRNAPKIQTQWFCICIITNWQTDTAEIRSQNSNNDQHNYNTIENAVVIPCISCQKRSQWAETLPKFRHNGIMYNGFENAVYMYEHKRSQRAATNPKNDLYHSRYWKCSVYVLSEIFKRSSNVPEF